MDDSRSHDQLERIQDRFTRTAEVFSTFVLQKRGEDAERLAELSELRESDRVLDAACGPGTYAIRFAPRVRTVVGLDYTPAMLARARATATAASLTNVSFSRGDVTAMPFGDRTFDVITCGFSIHHLLDPAAAVREFARVLTRGGRLALMDIIVAEPGRAEVNNRIEQARDTSHVHTHTQPQLLELVERAGLRLRTAERVESARSFNHWMHVSGAEPGEPAYEETRRLMETTFEDDSAGFHPQPPATPGADFQYTQTILYLIAER